MAGATLALTWVLSAEAYYFNQRFMNGIPTTRRADMYLYLPDSLVNGFMGWFRSPEEARLRDRARILAKQETYGRIAHLQRKGEYYVEIAKAAYDRQDYAEFSKYIGTGASLTPANLEAQRMCANLFFAFGRPDDAYQLLEESLEFAAQDQEHFRFYLRRCSMLDQDLFNKGIKTVNQRYLNRLVDLFEKNREITSDLQTFIKTLGSPQYPPMSFTPVFAGDPKKGGYADIPVDIWYEASSSCLELLNVNCGVETNYRSVEFVSQHQFDAKMRSSLISPVDNPEENDPILVTRNDKYFIYPYIPRITFTYIRTPNIPYFDYDIVNGVAVYLPPGSVHTNNSVLPAGTESLSVEFEYPESCVDHLIDMIKTYVGIGNENQWNIQTQMPSKV